MENLREEDNASLDRQIIIRVLAGKSEFFEEIVTKYKNLVFNLVLRSIADFDEVEDLVQDIFYKIYRNLHRFDLDKKFYSWLYTIAVNTIRNHLKKNRFQKMLFLQPSKNDNRSVADYAQVDGSLHEDMLHDELQTRLNDILSQLKDKYRLVIVLHYFESLSVQEIGEMLELPENTVKTHLRRGRAELMRLIEGCQKSETFFREVCGF